MRVLVAFFRHPAIDFLLLGAVLFALTRAFGGSARLDAQSIVIDGARLEDIRRAAIGLLGREPTPAELEAAVEAAVTEEILYREALARRLDVGDAVVERRLLQNMRFLSEDPGQDPAALVGQARAAGLQHGDPVVRRRLVQRMRTLLESGGMQSDPPEAELRAYYEAHGSDFEAPPKVVLEHIFYGGPGALDAASATLDKLRRTDASAGVARLHGHSFFAGASLPPHSQKGLAKLFGEEFAAKVMTLPVGVWSGPIASAYGVHLVWVHDRLPGQRLPFEAVRDRVRRRVMAESSARALREGIASLRRRYAVNVEWR